MSKAILGADVALFVDKSTTGFPMYNMIGGQKGASLSQSTAMHEYTHKGEGGQVKRYIPGSTEWSLECDGLFMIDDQATSDFLKAYNEKRELKIELRMPDNKKYAGKVLIENFDLEFSEDDTASYSTTLLGNGALELVEPDPGP
ncbi:phage tail tube protein [Sporosarcina saromensis]|uniref:Phage tail tube protein n=1 Tax=Sporosarcina saromensis TaxID=359365 RepID=A0ABU4G5C7_9BACL|nr:phage tail tube protein [Sporosarcina saromensis]MDW0112156.1 phage tail tube protein [Sporosarcina saromensis]